MKKLRLMIVTVTVLVGQISLAAVNQKRSDPNLVPSSINARTKQETCPNKAQVALRDGSGSTVRVSDGSAVTSSARGQKGI